MAHGDLPRPIGLAGVVQPGTITLVPDRHGDGTNVVALPTASRLRACRTAPARSAATSPRRWTAGRAVEVRRDPLLGLDIDTPADLRHPRVVEVLPPWVPTNPVNQHTST